MSQMVYMSSSPHVHSGETTDRIMRAVIYSLLPACAVAVFAGADGIRLEVRGDGRRYQARLRHETSFDGTSWRALFTAPEEWTVVQLPFDAFEATFRGRPVASAGPVRPDDVRQLGFLLADGEAGSFRLEVRALAPYSDSASRE